MMTMPASPKHFRIGLAVRLFVLLSIAGLWMLAGSDARGEGKPPGQLDAELEELVAGFDAGRTPDSFAGEVGGVDVDDGRARVIVEAYDGETGRVAGSAIDAGGRVEGSFGSLVQADVPIGELHRLAASSGVAEVRSPMRPYVDVTGEGVALTNASGWQSSGLTGAGVKVAILDLGFQGYEAKLGTELPASVTAMSFVVGGDIHGGGQPHGTGVAEVVHEMAPDAELYLANFSTEVELANATAWLASQGVRVINASWGYFTSGPGDGTGVVDEIIGLSVDAGVFWAVAAGNSAARHWSGQFVDTNANDFHDFAQSPFDEGNQLNGSFFGLLTTGEQVAAELRWNDPFGAACRDYDLYLMRTNDQDVAVPVASSQDVQNDGVQCIPGADPNEEIVFTIGVTDFYHLVIKKKVAATPATFDLFSASYDLKYQTPANSLLQPADSSRVTTVGAVPYYSPGTIEAFSSRGPTTDGRIKPDIAAPDGVSNATYGNFFGTSAASPHVAGAAALVLQIDPCFSPTQTGALLQSAVIDLGAAGKDNTFGSGRLLLGALPADADADVVGDPCDNCPNVANADQANQDADLFGDACEQPQCLTVTNYWVVPDGDSDCDGYPDSAASLNRAPESLVGTDSALKCAATTLRNDEPLPDRWPVDIDDNQLANGQDILFYNFVFGQPTTNPPVNVPGLGMTPVARFDLSGSGLVNGADILQFNAFFGKRCAP